MFIIFQFFICKQIEFQKAMKDFIFVMNNFFRMQKFKILSFFMLIFTLLSCNETRREAVNRAFNGEASTSNIAEGNDEKLKLVWNKIYNLKGSKSKKSKVFKISGKEWKISWKTTPQKNKEGEFILLLRDKRNKSDAEIIANVTGADEDTRYLSSKGNYYLVVNTNQNYEVWVEELVSK